MAKVGLDNFVKTISVKEFQDQNETLRKKQEVDNRNIPRGACFDKYHNMYVPYGLHFYRRVNDPRLILYRRGSQRRTKIRERRNDQWDVELTIDTVPLLLNKVTISHSGLNKEGRKVIKDSIRRIARKIPVYKYYNDYSFTQVIPPIKRKKVRPPSFHELLFFPDRLKIHGGIFNFRKQLKQEIINGMRHEFRYSPIIQSFYERRVMEEEENLQGYKTHIERRKEDRINFRGFIPLCEVIRAVRSIYEGNFSTPQDQVKFRKLVKNILLTSSEFIVSQQEFVLGYGDIFFAQCFIPTRKYFPYWKQTICRFTPAQTKESTGDYDIEDESYSSWISESDYGHTLFVEGELKGTENYHKVMIDVIRLRPKEEEGEEENNEEKEEIMTDSEQESPINSSPDPVIVMTEEKNPIEQIHG